MSVDRRFLGVMQMPPPVAVPIDLSPEAQIRWGLGYIRARYGGVVRAWDGCVWERRAPLDGMALRVLERLREHTGEWQTLGEVTRCLGGQAPVDAIEAISARGIRLEFTRSPEHRKPGPVVVDSWREAQGSALLRVRLP